MKLTDEQGWIFHPSFALQEVSKSISFAFVSVKKIIPVVMKLTIRNFGPITNLSIECNRVLILIGEQATGKSIVAKLLAIFNDIAFRTNPDINHFLRIYNIPFIQAGSLIEYRDAESGFYFCLADGETRIKNMPKPDSPLNTRRTVYIPAERILLAGISNSLFNFIKSNISLPECLVEYGALFEAARKVYTQSTPGFFGPIEYRFEGGTDNLVLNEQTTIHLSQGSSGLQSVIPMSVIVEAHKNSSTQFVVEEPELNLYPSAQKELVQYLAARCLSNQNQMVVTTHSPYILTAFSNLVQAHNAWEDCPDCDAEINSVVPRASWIPFNWLRVYYLANGNAADLLDYESRAINATAIDDVSETIASEYEKLLNIRYRD